MPVSATDRIFLDIERDASLIVDVNTHVDKAGQRTQNRVLAHVPLDGRLTIAMPGLRIPSAGQLGVIAQTAIDEAFQRLLHSWRRSRERDIPAALDFDLSAPLVQTDASKRCFCLHGWVGKGRPVVCHCEDGVGAGEGGDQRGDVVCVAAHELDASGYPFLCRGALESRVMARMCQDLSAKKVSATLPPCWPVMPVMTMSFIVSVIGRWSLY